MTLALLFAEPLAGQESIRGAVKALPHHLVGSVQQHQVPCVLNGGTYHIKLHEILVDHYVHYFCIGHARLKLVTQLEAELRRHWDGRCCLHSQRWTSTPVLETHHYCRELEGLPEPTTSGKRCCCVKAMDVSATYTAFMCAILAYQIASVYTEKRRFGSWDETHLENAALR